jgi:TatD DNase family protein
MAVSADESLQRARDAGVEKFVVIGTDAETSAAAIAIAQEHSDVWATVGLHPHDSVNGVDSIVSYIASPKVIAIGECGLDYYYDHSPRDIQMVAFRQQIALAKQHDLTLVIHTRDAWDDTFKVLDSEGMPANTIIHCFTGGPEEARKCLFQRNSHIQERHRYSRGCAVVPRRSTSHRNR